MVAKILSKSLMTLPSTDFLLCTYLLSDRLTAGVSPVRAAPPAIAECLP